MYLRYQLLTEYSLRVLRRTPEQLPALHRPKQPPEAALQTDHRRYWRILTRPTTGGRATI